jgi:hypothetical protein
MGNVVVFFAVGVGTTVRMYFAWGQFPGYITGGIERIELVVVIRSRPVSWREGVKEYGVGKEEEFGVGVEVCVLHNKANHNNVWVDLLLKPASKDF